MLGRSKLSMAVAALMAPGILAVGCDERSVGEDDGVTVSGIEAVTAPMRKGGCDFRVARDARSFFPGSGKGSVKAQALDLIDQIKDACRANDGETFTARWFDLAQLTESVVAAGTGGDPVAGGAVFAKLIQATGPDGVTKIFDPCGADDAECTPWDGYPSSTPDFARVLASPNGAWGVVEAGTDPVCSAFDNGSSCESWDAATQGDKWGVEPGRSGDGATWAGALHGRRSLLFGHPLDAGATPTGEDILGASLPAFRWLLIPEPDAFAVDASPPEILEVGLCSTAVPQAIEVIQKGSTILREASLDWCLTQTGVAFRPRSALGRFLDFLSPVPEPLVATALGSRGPGGSAGSFTDFFAGDVPSLAQIGLSAEPAGGTVGEVIIGEDGQPFTISTFTTSEGTPIEDAAVSIRIVGNGGLIPSGNDASGSAVECADFICTGFTQADEQPAPGSLVPELVITKPGQYSLCVSATLAPLVFSTEVCTGKFIMNP